MSRFNSKVKKSTSVDAINDAGGVAYKLSDKKAFLNLLLTSFLQNMFYKSGIDQVCDVAEMIKNIPDKKWVAKALVYARQTIGMRSITHAGTAELAHTSEIKNTDWFRKFVSAVVRRPDDINEIMSYYIAKFNPQFPMALKRGLSDAFCHFDDYQVAKYQQKNKELKLVDVVNLLHPIPTERNKESLSKLIKDELKVENTWESKVSKAGKDAASEATTEEEKEELKQQYTKEAWQTLLKEKRLGYQALLQNLSNIAACEDSNITNMAVEYLKNEAAVKHSLIMPFKFYTAYKELQDRAPREILGALTDAMEISLDNVPHLSGKTLVAVDVSGSMSGVSDIAAMFAAALFKSKNYVDVMLFADNHKFIILNSRDSLFTLMEQIHGNGGTSFEEIASGMEDQAVRGIKYDRLFILSDMQACHLKHTTHDRG